MIDFKLYLITDRKQLSETPNSQLPTPNLLSAVRQALKAGVKAVQLREKDLGTRELLKLAYKMKALTTEYGAKLFINDRLDIALAVGADGIHLAQSSIPADLVRKTIKRKFLIGVSTHSLKEVREAEKAGADFITLGPIYKTPSKLKYGLPLGINTLKRISRKTGLPIFAIGGIKAKKINELINAGAWGVAMISGILGASDIQGKTEEIINIPDNQERFIKIRS